MTGPPEDRARDGLDELHTVLGEEIEANAEQRAVDAVDRRMPRWVTWAVLSAAAVSILASSAVSVALSGLYDRQAQAEAAITAARRLAEEAREQGIAANAELLRRGQAAVPIPTPGTAPDSEVLTAAAAARVLAQLPDMRPTAAQLGAAIGTYLAANPITPAGPTPTQIAAALAGYFATSPPPSGPPGPSGEPGAPGAKGEKGEPGRPPTAEEIQVALASYLSENPNALCPKGGEFAQLRVMLADGRTADTWQCVVAVQPAAVRPTTAQTGAPGLLRKTTGR